MPRPVNRLSARTVATLKKPGRHADGAGLYLHIDDNLSKRWVFVFQWRGRRKEMGLGSVSLVSLVEAREAALAARKLVATGVNPIEDRRRVKSDARTFGEVAEEVIADLASGWKGDAQEAAWRDTLKQHAAPLWNLAVDQVDTEDVLGALKPIWTKIPETASRVRGRIERVLDAARAKGLRSGENPARWRGHLKLLLPARQRLARGHHAALPYEDAPAFWTRLSEREGAGVRALRWTILTVARENEALGATEREIKGAVWIVPAERMKGGREHRVPLTAAALAELRLTGNPDALLFPGAKPGRPLSNMTMDMQLRKMGVKATPHGFRSTFRDWAGDKTNFPREVAEAALAHLIGDEAERAYRRGDALDKRRRLMEAWAGYLLGEAQVVTLRRVR
jgi:integrase